MNSDELELATDLQNLIKAYQNEAVREEKHKSDLKQLILAYLRSLPSKPNED
jgi:hypothetical protein